MSVEAFLDRVFSRLPAAAEPFRFSAWSHPGKSTKEGVGVLPSPGVDVEALAARIMDVGHYRGNIAHVEESRLIADANHTPPTSVRFYQRIKIPLVSELQMEISMHDLGERDGWRVCAWQLLDAETSALNPKRGGARSEYNDGAWLIKPDRVGYALSSAPRKGDVGRIKFAVLTKGADAGAAQVVKANIEGMIRWSRKA